MPNSGWPFTKAELDPFYARALRLCEAGGEYKFHAEETFPEKQREIIAGFDGPRRGFPQSAGTLGTAQRISGKRYAHELQAAGNITVLLNANCLGVQLDKASGRVELVRARPPSMRNEFFVQSAVFHHRVRRDGDGAAAAGVERRAARAGIGNHSDKLGRYYMSHLFGALAV